MIYTQTEFEIHYQFEGESRHFLHQAPHLCEIDALHFATLHAGVGTFSGNVSAGPLRLATLQAQGFGVTQVHWKKGPERPRSHREAEEAEPDDTAPAACHQIAG